MLHKPTNRPNLFFNVIHSFISHKTLDNTIHNILSQPAAHKAIIFCRSHEVAELIAGRLGVPFFYGHMIPLEINLVLSQLRMGIVRLIVSTSVLMVALDVINLKWVIHFIWHNFLYSRNWMCQLAHKHISILPCHHSLKFNCLLSSPQLIWSQTHLQLGQQQPVVPLLANAPI
jgi:hypothetical protein